MSSFWMGLIDTSIGVVVGWFLHHLKSKAELTIMPGKEVVVRMRGIIGWKKYIVNSVSMFSESGLADKAHVELISPLKWMVESDKPTAGRS